MGQVQAVLLDTTSIQKYIFAGNKLKENLGASYLVANIYKKELAEALKMTLGSDPDLASWKENPDQVLIKDNEDVRFEAGYIGGGNALLFFRSKDEAKELVKNWTRQLLLNAPGLTTAVAIDDFDLDNYAEEREKLYQQLARNKNRYFPNTVPAKHGITADCPLSGLTGEIAWKNEAEDTVRYISAASWAKIEACDESQREINEEYKDILGDKYIFTAEIDKLGQSEGKNHLAIVHIDGNNMGKRFKACTDLAMSREFSRQVDELTRNTFRELLKDIIGNMDKIKAAGINIQEEKEKTILPIRPIVLNGDDITFVTDGRLGIYLAERFIRHGTKGKLNDEKPLCFCAGVAIIKTKFPFLRGYQLAEELCASAKKAARTRKRQRNNDSSWIDFYVAYGGKSGSLAEIRERHYQEKDGRLYFGPYLLDDGDDYDEKGISYFKSGIQEMLDKNKWPRSKLKKLRSTLPLGKEATRKFIDEMKARHLELPSGPGGYAVNGWENATTPYFDMVELMEFYPKLLLDE